MVDQLVALWECVAVTVHTKLYQESGKKTGVDITFKYPSELCQLCSVSPE